MKTKIIRLVISQTKDALVEEKGKPLIYYLTILKDTSGQVPRDDVENTLWIQTDCKPRGKRKSLHRIMAIAMSMLRQKGIVRFTCTETNKIWRTPPDTNL
ncbi:MAG: hypothetical protein Q7R93_01700 [bacterium]|nr:hypothetical protein [bacterium]